MQSGLMTILKATLKIGLQKFLDDQYAGFTGYATSAADHKTKFDAAIDTYLAPITVINPVTVLPNNTQIDASNSGLDFSDELILAVGEPSLQYDIEMSDGFEAMITKAVLAASGDYFGGTINPISLINPLVAASKSAVKTAVNTISQTFNTGGEFCEAIADAIHTNALLDYKTTCTYLVLTPPSTPPVTGAPLDYG